MKSADFEYDGKCLSDYGMIICDFDGGSGVSEVSAGSVITFQKVPRHYGKRYGLVSTQYDQCVTATFDVCKDPQLYSSEAEMEIYDEEYRQLMRWLNRRRFLRFALIGECQEDKEVCYWNASFNVNKIEIDGKLYGLRLTLETDRPFGYGQPKKITLHFANGGEQKTMVDMSDEIGSCYPNLTITLEDAGDLELTNETEHCVTVIRNCKAGEVIRMFGDTHIISSDLDGHDICNDFNYAFFRIGNTMENRVNRIRASLPCQVVIEYAPVIKDAV